MSNITRFVSRKVLSDLTNAPRTAEAIERPLNTIVTLATYQAEVGEEGAFRLFQKLKDEKFGRWASYTPVGEASPRNGPPTFAWIREAPNGMEHIHWLLHVEPQNHQEFRHKITRWSQDVYGNASWADRMLDVRDIYYPNGMAKYCCKGADPAHARFYNIYDSYLSDQGRILGKRGGVSQNLGPQVRKEMRRGGIYRQMRLAQAA